uniref:Uncharacterized protein n=1 Tax=Strombidium rassoulzadegani TaxID=1082188 RepID=A0A7S3CKE6_9SPIT|mmetsp:Transcript_11198/g.18828  ORF Transcript_11198/g.18828 Transcript_11198/m.18828 type:complete len:403 (+) Transcript_11198:1598-2806(+)
MMPGFAHDSASGYSKLLKHFNMRNARKIYDHQISLKEQSALQQREEDVSTALRLNKRALDEDRQLLSAEKEQLQQKKSLQKQLLVNQKSEKLRQVIDSHFSDMEVELQLLSKSNKDKSREELAEMRRRLQKVDISKYQQQQMLQREAIQKHAQRLDQTQDQAFLKNIGFNEKTNYYLHKKSQVVKKRVRDEDVAKDLSQRAWDEPPSAKARPPVSPPPRPEEPRSLDSQKQRRAGASKGPQPKEELHGTIYNQFYRFNPETKPMKPLPRNLESQIERLEREQRSKLTQQEQLMMTHSQKIQAEQEQRLRLEQQRRKEELSHIQRQNFNQHLQRNRQQLKDRDVDRLVEDRKALEDKSRCLEQDIDEAKRQKRKNVQNARELERQIVEQKLLRIQEQLDYKEY